MIQSIDKHAYQIQINLVDVTFNILSKLTINYWPYYHYHFDMYIEIINEYKKLNECLVKAEVKQDSFDTVGANMLLKKSSLMN